MGSNRGQNPRHSSAYRNYRAGEGKAGKLDGKEKARKTRAIAKGKELRKQEAEADRRRR